MTAPSLTLSASSLQTRYGEPIHLAGTVSSKKAGESVGIFSRPFTSSGFAKVANVTTGAKGGWTWDVEPGVATTYQARMPGAESRTLLIGVRPAVTLTQLDNGRLRVEADAARSFAGKTVKVQRMNAGGWTTLAQLHLNRNSRALVPDQLVPQQTATLRATMSVNQAGQGYLGGFSAPLVLPARWVSLSVSSNEVSFGQPITLSGLVSTRTPGMPLTILARPASTPEFQTLKRLTTGAGGRWSLQTRPHIGTTYAAQFSGTNSRVLGVGVHPVVKVRIISQGRVSAHVDAYRSMAGRFVQVQQLVEGQWQTVAKQKLDRNSDTIFPAPMLPGGTATLRIAMSVNQAGVGYMAAFSPSFVYQR